MKTFFSLKDLIKYIIFIGIIYGLMIIIPSQEINKINLIFIVSIIYFSFIFLDCLNNNSELISDTDFFTNITDNSNLPISALAALAALVTPATPAARAVAQQAPAARAVAQQAPAPTALATPAVIQQVARTALAALAAPRPASALRGSACGLGRRRWCMRRKLTCTVSAKHPDAVNCVRGALSVAGA
jgi:hypothetical protein